MKHFLSFLYFSCGLIGAVNAQTKLVLKEGSHISIIGNTLADRMQHDGFLETSLHQHFPKHNLTIRNLGFSADTITKRPRSQSFGSPEDWLRKNITDVVLAFFGYNESFAENQDEFARQLRDLITSTRSANYGGKGNAEIILFSPVAHENMNDPNLPDGSENNARLAATTQTMAAVANELKVTYVDLFTASQKLYSENEKPLTINGVHLNAFGNEQIAVEIQSQLFGRVLPPKPELHEAVLDKNFHWWTRYRTVDGYNVYGGRSKLSWHNQSNFDVMQREMKIFDVMTANRDERIWAVARGSKLEVKDDNLPPNLEVITNRPGPNEDKTYSYKGSEEAIADMTIHEGMEVNLFASEEQFPELINPVQMAVDTDSRLWVATWPTYPHWNPTKPMNDKLVILPDENGDGEADKMIVFADQLNSVTGFEFWGGGVIVAAAPHLLFLKDTDGDDKADIRIPILNGVSSADSHHTANALTMGPDGGIYFSRGVFHVTNMETPTRTYRSTASGVYRFDPRTYEFDFHFGIGPNPHGNCFDAWGYQFATDGTSGTGDYVAIGHGQRAPHRLYQKRVRPVPASKILASSHFQEHEGNFLICNAIGFLGVINHKFHYDGADVTCKEVDPILVSKDRNFRPSDIEIGGDGALYVADWQQALIGHMQHNIRDPNRDDSHGRIYRVTKTGSSLLTPAKMKGKPAAEVVQHFLSPAQATRYRARLEMSGRSTDEAVAAVAKFAKSLDPSDPTQAQALLECLFVHSEHRVPNRELADRVYQAAEPKIRAAATRCGRYWVTNDGQWISFFLKAAGDPEAIVRAEAIIGAGFAEPSIESAEVVFAAAGHSETDPQTEANIKFTTGKLNLNNIVKQHLSDGGTLSQAAQKFMVARSDNRTLLAMAKNDLVNREILIRTGIKADDRLAALEGLSKTSGSSAATLLVETIQNASDKAPINDYASLLAHMSADQLAPLKSQLAGIQKFAENPVLRMATTAALINTGESATGLLKQALDSRANLENFLAAIPLISNDDARSSLYPTLQPLVHELPKHLHPEKAGVASSGVRYSYYKRFKNTLLETIDTWEPDATGTTDKFTLRIEGLNIERITLKFDSWINIPASGEWKFHLSSDDGSRLYIDGESIMDMPIGSRSASRVLSAGPHAIALTYYDSGGGDSLKLEWEGPGTPRSEVPAEALKSSGVDVIKRGLAEALTHIPGHDAGIFADFVTLLNSRQQGDLAIQTISAQPEDQWPADQMQPLAKALARFVPETPLEERDGEVFQASLKLGERVAKKLPEADATKLRATLSNLDLQVVRIVTVVEEMRYDRPEFTVKAGSPVKLVLENPDGIPHNLVIVKPGTAQKVAKLAEAMGLEGFEKQFLPESDDILHATPKLLNQNETATLSFEAPKEPGIYEYVCTFPGHWMLMRGKMHVVK